MMKRQRLVAMAVCLALGLVACGSSEDTFDADDALAVAESYFDTYNSGDVESVLALFEPGATFSNSFGVHTRADWEQLLAWNAAQGTILSPPDCTVTEEIPEVSVTVSCPHTNLDVLVQAVDGPPVAIGLRLTISDDGISDWDFNFGKPDFNAVAIPFRRWMTENHPEDANVVGFGNWTSVEEAERNGILTAQYAKEWGAEIEAGNCDYVYGC